MVHLPYFTILHWLDLAFFLVLFIFLTILSVKAAGDNVKLLISMIFASFLATSFAAIVGLVILEKYTKKAVLLNVEQRRVLINETLVIKGEVKNIGKFKINYCKLDIQLVNSLWGKNFPKGTFFRSDGLSFFGFKQKRLAKPNEIKETKYIVTNGLEPGQIKFFSVIIPYPPYFTNAHLYYKLYCH